MMEFVEDLHVDRQHINENISRHSDLTVLK